MHQLPAILVTDVETTSLNPLLGGLVGIGAEWLTGPRAGQEFEIRCRPRFTAEIEPKAIEVNGCDWLQDMTVAPEGEAVDSFLDWVGEGPVLMAGNNPRFDWEYLRAGHDRSWFSVSMPSLKPDFPFPHRQVDMHSLAIAHAIRHGLEFTSKGIYTDAILEMLGLPPEPKPHLAIAGARATAAALRILLGLPTP